MATAGYKGEKGSPRFSPERLDYYIPKPERIPGSFQCRFCGASLNDGNWYASQRKQYVYVCKPCQNKRSVEYDRNNRKRQRARAIRGTRKHYRKNREDILREIRRLRFEALAALGGKCSHCGFEDTRALQIDHVKGGGTRLRKSSQKPGHKRYYQYVIQHAQTGEFQLLCANCNWIKRFEKLEGVSIPYDSSELRVRR